MKHGVNVITDPISTGANALAAITAKDKRIAELEGELKMAATPPPTGPTSAGSAVVAAGAFPAPPSPTPATAHRPYFRVAGPLAVRPARAGGARGRRCDLR